MTPATTTSPEQRVRKARKVATDAINHAAIVQANPVLARSTRSRAAFKHKAAALDQVARILSGKE